MKALAALLICLAANSAVAAECETVKDAAARLGKSHSGAEISIPQLVDQPVIKAFLEAEGLEDGSADLFIAVQRPRWTLFVRVLDGMVCASEKPVLVAGDLHDELTGLIVRWRARKGLPAPSGAVPEFPA